MAKIVIYDEKTGKLVEKIEIPMWFSFNAEKKEDRI